MNPEDKYILGIILIAFGVILFAAAEIGMYLWRKNMQENISEDDRDMLYEDED